MATSTYKQKIPWYRSPVDRELLAALNQRSENSVVGIDKNPSGVNATQQTMTIGARMNVTNNAWNVSANGPLRLIGTPVHSDARSAGSSRR